MRSFFIWTNYVRMSPSHVIWKRDGKNGQRCMHNTADRRNRIELAVLQDITTPNRNLLPILTLYCLYMRNAVDSLYTVCVYLLLGQDKDKFYANRILYNNNKNKKIFI